MTLQQWKDSVMLREWSVCGDSYQAPETRRLYLKGRAYKHPRHPDGTWITTSYVVDAKGCTISCKSRTYVLDGPPCESYLKYLEEIKYRFDPENPVKMIKE